MNVDPPQFIPEPTGFQAFAGTGNRLDGKKRKEEGTESAEGGAVQRVVYQRGIPDYDYVPGTLRFMRHAKPQQDKEVRFLLYTE